MFFFYDENGTPSAFVYNGSTYYYQTNLQGDVAGIVNYAGTKVASYSYDAYAPEMLGVGELQLFGQTIASIIDCFDRDGRNGTIRF